MFRLSLLLLCLLLLQSLGENAPVQGTRTPVIGVGVEAKIIVVYDTEDYKKNYTARDPLKNNVMWYFLDGFDKVQRHFREQSVKVTLSVVTVELNETIWVKKNGSRVINETLQQLQRVDEHYYPRPNETTAFLFTSEQLPNETNTATMGTICHVPRSTAIVVQQPGSTNYTSILEAMAKIFGASGAVNFTEDDIEKMNNTFTNCYIKRKRRINSTRKTRAETATSVMNDVSVNK
uniref:28 kDa Metastriate family member n=1 Tax=Rhipicephalus zambeziensis TaxID=60191 RepID=A0A224Y0W1_9ACAR